MTTWSYLANRQAGRKPEVQRKERQSGGVRGIVTAASLPLLVTDTARVQITSWIG
jgi:hypothetical protein